MKNFKWIVADLDGTLIHHQDNFSNTIYSDVVEQLNKSTKNKKFSIATGRHYKDVLSIIERFEIEMPKDSYIIGSNGCQIYSLDSKKLILNKILANSIIKNEMPKVIAHLNKSFPHKTLVFAYGEKEQIFFIKNDSKNFDQMADNVLNHEDNDGVFKYSTINDISELKNITKFCVDFLEDIPNPVDLIHELQKISPEVDFVNTGPGFLEVIKKNVNKATALDYINENYYNNIKNENILVFGDSGNDLEMMDYAGTSVTREDARDEVKSRATLIYPGGASKFVKNALIDLVK